MKNGVLVVGSSPVGVRDGSYRDRHPSSSRRGVV